MQNCFRQVENIDPAIINMFKRLTHTQVSQTNVEESVHLGQMHKCGSMTVNTPNVIVQGPLNYI